MKLNLPKLLSDNKIRLIEWAVVAMVAFYIAWCFWKPAPPKPEVYKPEVKQADGSVVLEKKPDPTAKPKQIIPKGSTVERVVSVTVTPDVKPQGKPDGETGKPATCQPCAPVTIDLSVVKNKDETRSVVASSPDGKVVGGVDIPVGDAKPFKETKWAAGATYNPFKSTFGVFVDRDISFVRIGAEVFQERTGVYSELGGVVKAGIKF